MNFFSKLIQDIRANRALGVERSKKKEIQKGQRKESIKNAHEKGILALLEYLTAELKHKFVDQTAMLSFSDFDRYTHKSILAYITWDIKLGPDDHFFDTRLPTFTAKEVTLEINKDSIVISKHLNGWIGISGNVIRKPSVTISTSSKIEDIETEVRDALATCEPKMLHEHALGYRYESDSEMSTRKLILENFLSPSYIKKSLSWS
ncbi:MAG: hypothetical protein HY225_03870 [Candidatus Vogelbacteria bacterium]|nr:hypothetical protein [Candidatus Vogelbacteria bacterium]